MILEKQRESVKENALIEKKYLNDPKYGLVPDKPVFVEGFDGMHWYLNNLCTDKGLSPENNRFGSMEVKGTSGPVDIIDLFLAGNKPYMRIFVCIYGTGTSGKAPKGLKLGESF